MSLLLASLVLCNCQTVKTKFIPDIEICAEIPFQDGPEGACATNLSKKTRIIPTQEWVESRPTMIMISAENYSAIKISWKKACRAFKANCDHEMKSIDDIIRGLDEILKEIKK